MKAQSELEKDKTAIYMEREGICSRKSRDTNTEKRYNL